MRGTVKNVTDEGVQIALEVTCGDAEGARHAEGGAGCLSAVTLLADLTTLRLGGPARELVRATTEDELRRRRTPAPTRPGTPLLLRRRRQQPRGRRRRASTAPSCTSRPAASSVEQDTVRRRGGDRRGRRALGRRSSRAPSASGWVGVEALSGHPRQRRRDPGPERRRLRPGGRRHRRLGALLGPRRDRVQRTFAAADCGFGYRTSRFKRDPDRLRRARRDLPAPARRPLRAGALRRAGPHPRRRGRRPGAAGRGARGGARRCAAARAWCSTTTTTTPGAPARSSPTRCSTPGGGRLPDGAPRWAQPDGTRQDQRRLADRARRVRQGLRQRPGRRCRPSTRWRSPTGAAPAPRTCWRSPARSGAACTTAFGVWLVNEPVLVGCSLPALTRSSTSSRPGARSRRARRGRRRTSRDQQPPGPSRIGADDARGCSRPGPRRGRRAGPARRRSRSTVRLPIRQANGAMHARRSRCRGSEDQRRGRLRVVRRVGRRRSRGCGLAVRRLAVGLLAVRRLAVRVLGGWP